MFWAEHYVMFCGLGEHIYKAVFTLRASSQLLTVFKDQRNELEEGKPCRDASKGFHLDSTRVCDNCVAREISFKSFTKEYSLKKKKISGQET